MSMSTALGLLLALSAPASAAPTVPASPKFATGSIRFLQPDAELKERIKPEEILVTIQAVMKLAEDWSVHTPGGDACVVYVGLRPAAKFRSWTVCEHADGSTLDREIARKLPAASVAAVANGTVLFVIHGTPAWSQQFGKEQMPKSWLEAAGKDGADVEELVDRAWPH